MNRKSVLIVSVTVMMVLSALRAGESPALRLSWERDILTISGDQLPGKAMKILYIEAYCRPNSQTTDWATNTVIGHTTELIGLNPDRTQLNLKCTLKDGVIVDHVITAHSDEVDFRLVCAQPDPVHLQSSLGTTMRSRGRVHWIGRPQEPQNLRLPEEVFHLPRRAPVADADQGLGDGSSI